MHKLVEDFLLILIKTFVYSYEIITLPVYFFFKKPRKYVLFNENEKFDPEQHKTLSLPTKKDDPSSPWRAVENMDKLDTEIAPGCDMAYHMWLKPYSNYPNNDAMGTRKTLKLEYEILPNGKKFIKAVMGSYEWESYYEAELRISKIAAGLYNLFGSKIDQPIAIYSETRAEWFYSSQAIFRTNTHVVTLYATLGMDALIQGLNESQPIALFISHELVGNLPHVLDKCPSIKYVFYFSNGIYFYKHKELDRIPEIFKGDFEEAKKKFGDKFKDIIELEEIGAKELEEYKRDEKTFQHPGYRGIWMHPKEKASPDTLAFVMYTSGSTGTPKGVEITHRNLAASSGGFIRRLPVLYCNDTLISYLPLAHVFELASELTCISSGIRIGYGSPQTLVDTSSRIKFGECKGDITELCPTLFNFVPIVIDRVSKAVFEKMNDKGPFYAKLLRFTLEYRKRRILNGYPGFLSNYLIINKIRRVLGGNIRFVISGGAPLSEEASWFTNICFGQVIQGYGLTETASCCALMPRDDPRGGHIGAPVGSLEIRLREWKEGGYSPFDKPNPRGEVLISGGVVTLGYHKKPELTQNDFFVDEQGKRWFCTGDIGRFNIDGSLSIIDRKKDLVKLQAGEYVSLGKVELKIAQHDLIESICVYADSRYDFIIAFLSPKRKQLSQIAQSNNILPTAEDLQSLTDNLTETEEGKMHHFLCQNDKINTIVLKEIEKFGRLKKLATFEIPKRIILDSLAWTPDTGLVTDALKLKRHAIKKRFEVHINKIYGDKASC